MPVTTAAGRTALRRITETPGGAVLAFDFDGTLAPIVPDPRDARAHPDAVPALQRLAPLVKSIVIVTGRPAETAVELGGLSGIPGLAVLGQYGREQWEDGRLTAPEEPPGVRQARDALPHLLERVGAPQGIWIEDKGQAVAVHTRRAADPDTAVELLRAPLAELADQAGLTVEPGRMVLELRPPGMDKGAALTGFLRSRAAESLLYAGDDLGDLAAFDAVERLRAEGLPGITVCSGSAEVAELAERADLVVEGPEGVVGLLRTLAEESGAL